MVVKVKSTALFIGPYSNSQQRRLAAHVFSICEKGKLRVER
jgi:hypothetical protein